jgi:tetratricopeptide (TPR) repeat protein
MASAPEWPWGGSRQDNLKRMFSLDQLQLLPPGKWEDLENLVKDLFRAEWRDFHAQRHGRQGQAQQGVDVFGQPSSVPGWAGVQCKNKDLLIRPKLTVKELKEEVRKARSFQPPLGQFIIATTAPRDARLQLEARKLTDRHSRRGRFSVHVYAWDDIVELLAKHERVAMRYYGNVLGGLPEGRRPLLSEETMTAALEAEVAPPAADSQAATSPLILPAPAARALGILATSPLPLPEDAYRQLFPDIDWKAVVPTLVTAKAVTGDAEGLQVAKTTRDSFLPSPADSRPYIDAWVAALEPLREHVDMAVLLSVQYLARQEHGKAVEVLLELAPGLERGFWNDLYASVLQTYGQPALLKRLSDEQRRKFFVAYGFCLARGRTPSDALPWAARLRRVSARAGDHWGIAQSMMLAGIARQNCEDVEKAADDYRRTIAYGRRHRLPLLVGHALHNLAMLRSDSDPGAAARLLEESIRAKQQAGDEPGRVGAMFGRGTLAVSQGQPAEAYKWFARAGKLAARMDMRYTRALALCNMGTALVDQHRPREAIPMYKAAQELAEEEGFADGLALAVGGEAYACLAMHRFARAHEFLIRLHQLRREMGQEEAAIIALHDAGACLLKQGKGEDARKALKEALAEARTHGVLEWVYQCNKDFAITYIEEGDIDRAVSVLRESATAEEHDRRFGVAAKLWESVANVLADRAAESSLIEEAFLRAIAALEHEGDSVDRRIRLLSGLYECRWSSLAFDRALDALRDIERLARDSRRREALSWALDQRGMCLQLLGRAAEAVAEHRKALTIARRLPETVVAENCLNNLGEALRKTGRSAAAIRTLREAEALARARGDLESAIAMAHNRALALENLGRRSQARRVLQRCRDTARRLGLWHEYVRGLHGLANHAWLMGEPDEAVRQYRRALAEAKKCDIPEQVGPIALNYANALRYQKRPKPAFQVMQAAEKHFLNLPDAHDYLAHLGATLAEAGDVAAAKDAYQRARQHALLVGDAAEAALAAGALANLFEQEADYIKADEVLREALARKPPPEQRAALLNQRLGVLLKAGKAQQAGKVFATIQRLTETDGLKAEAVDAHMLLGDHYWDTGKSRTEAVKAYTAALIPAAEVGLEVMVRTGIYTVQRLLSLEEESRLHEIDRIETSLQTWLKQQLGAKHATGAVAIALWPLRVARRCTLASRGGPALSERQVADVLREEVLGMAKQHQK